MDIDLYKEDRQPVFDYIIERFGEQKTAYVFALTTNQEKGTIDDIGRALGYELDKVKKIKSDFETDPIKAKEKHKELFYYFDGLVGTKISQSKHPAGIVVSPVSLPDNYGTHISDDNDIVLQLDMEAVHEIGLAKYDLLGLRTIGIIKTAFSYLGRQYPLSHEIDWNDQKVWDDMRKSPIGIFQMEEPFTHKVFSDFTSSSIDDMSIVTAMIRPAAASFREKLVKRIHNVNPDPIIDELLKENYGYILYQEDVIKFLQDICGFSGSEADTVRRGIGRKNKELLDKAMPKILSGYCEKSSKPKEVSEQDAKQFLQIIEDASSYQFNRSHAVAYSMLGYICGWLRYYHPYEFITAFFNCSESTSDIVNGTILAKSLGISIEEPKFRYAKSTYSFDKETKTIYKSADSIKHISANCIDGLYELRENEYRCFTDLLLDLKNISIDNRKTEILIKLDFFSEFGNAKELLRIKSLFYQIGDGGKAKTISKDKISDSTLFNIITRHSSITEKKFEKIDYRALFEEVENYVKSRNIEDFSIKEKIAIQNEYLGYINIKTNPTDMNERRKLFVTSCTAMKMKRETKRYKIGDIWGYSIKTYSIGSGVNGSFTIFSNAYNKNPFRETDIIFAKKVEKNDRGYWNLLEYDIINI